MHKSIKSLLRRIFSRFGYQIARIPVPAPHPPEDPLCLRAALARVLALCPDLKTVVDVGASDGSWSRVVQGFLPAADYLLIEANPCHEASLTEYKKQQGRVDFVMAAAGDKAGEINFDASDLLGGVATEKPRDVFAEFNLQWNHLPPVETFIRIPCTTIDAEVAKRKLEGPFFLKLDVHGFEIPILDGAVETLRNTALIQIEVYNFNLTKDALRFAEMIIYLEGKGFRVIDVCDLLHRPRDGYFWQMDLLLIPKTSAVFEVNSYK